jgi:hypothetical protein
VSHADEIPAGEWMLYLGSQKDCHGWAHLLLENEDTGQMVLCTHPAIYPDGTSLMRVHPTSVQRDLAIAEKVAQRMAYYDPRKETTP